MTGSGLECTDPLPGGAEVDASGNPRVVWLWGEHDLSTVSSVTSALLAAVGAADRDVVVDLSEVTFMDASILGQLVHGQQFLATHGHSLCVRAPHLMQSKVLEICGLADLIEAEPSIPAVREHDAQTALETWIDVPPTAPLSAAPPAVRPGRSRGDPLATRG